MGSELNSIKKQLQQDQALELYMAGLLGEALADSFPRVQKELPIPPVEEVSQPQVEVLAASAGEAVSSKENGKKLPVGSEIKQTNQRPQKKCTEQKRLNFLTLKVGNFSLATSLSDLSGALSYPEVISSLAGQPGWFLGLMQHQGAKIAVVDLGLLIYREQSGYQRSLTEKPYSKVALLKGGRWGVACDEIGEIIHPENDEVKLREQRESRPWLLGTIASPPMALIDLKRLIPI